MTENTEKIKKILIEKSFVLDQGISSQRAKELEAIMGADFPPDLLDLIMNFVPRGNGGINPKFPDWNTIEEGELHSWQQSAVEGILFDVELNEFWFEKWGERPVQLDDRLGCARKKMQDVPKLIPVAGHRFIPSLPHEEGNPVLSVHQTDIIVYGDDLYTYFRNEYSSDGFMTSINAKYCPFWSELLS